MTPPQDSLRASSSAESADAPSSFVSRALAATGTHEQLLLGYLVLLLVAVLHGGGPRRDEAAVLVGADLASFSVALLVARGSVLRHRFGVDLVQRLLVLGVIFGTFLQLQVILPAARGATYDDQLHRIDLALFGFEPATSWDRWVSPATTEWFSFFYFSYFVLLVVHVVPMMLFERRTRLVGEFALGMVCLYGIGQLMYVLVPAFGPYKTIAFEHALAGGFWWDLVQSGARAVDETSRTDVFPSLHTAGPTFLALFSFRHRAKVPFRYTWPVVAFFATQIIGATMFLRWHYLIDVVAGVLLAVLALVFASRVATEERSRETRGSAPLWRALSFRSTRQ